MTTRWIVAWSLVAGAAHAQTPLETATAHYQRGIELMTKSPKDYAAAAREFEEAHILDPDPKYLYNLALAKRLGGDCRAALDHYRAYLATNPSAVNVKNANIGIERCEQLLATQTPVETKPDPVETQPVVTEPVKTEPVKKPIDEPIETAPTSRGRDGIGTTLVIGGGVFALASVTFYILARGAASETHDVGPLPDFEAARDRANSFQGVSIITGVIGTGLITAGVIRFATRKQPRTNVTLAPSGGGASLVVGGRF